MTENKLKDLNIPELKHKKVYTQEYVDKLEKENAKLRVQLKWEQDTKSEIADLLGKANDENEQLRNNGFTVSAMTEQQLKAAIEKGEQLEKQLEQAKKVVRTAIEALYSGGTDTEMMDRCEEILKQFLKETEE